MKTPTVFFVKIRPQGTLLANFEKFRPIVSEESEDAGFDERKDGRNDVGRTLGGRWEATGGSGMSSHERQS